MLLSVVLHLMEAGWKEVAKELLVEELLLEELLVGEVLLEVLLQEGRSVSARLGAFLGKVRLMVVQQKGGGGAWRDAVGYCVECGSLMGHAKRWDAHLHRRPV